MGRSVRYVVRPHTSPALPVRQVEQELQHTDSGQLRREQARAPNARILVDEVLVTPQPVEPISDPRRRRTARMARTCNLCGQRRNLLTGTGADEQKTPRQLIQAFEPAPSVPDDHTAAQENAEIPYRLKIRICAGQCGGSLSGPTASGGILVL